MQGSNLGIAIWLNPRPLHPTLGDFGTMMRKYGLSVDKIIDAQLVDVNGNILNRKTMGEDLFWAIRGGGASFGAILSWKISLVQVPPTVTAFKVARTLEEGATDVFYKWQLVSSKLDKELFIRATSQVVKGGSKGSKKISISFIGLFLGQSGTLLSLLSKSFPELGLQQQDCKQMRWIESVVFWANLPNATSPDALLNRPSQASFFKKKSDFVKHVIPKNALENIWKVMMKVEPIWMQWNPYGGRMDEIPATATPFPHRAGNLFKIEYSTTWIEQGVEAINRHTSLLRQLHDAMSPYVSKYPREAFLNYRDLDIGSNPSNQTNFEEARVYGSKYFKENFLRLVTVKSRVDPENFFKNEQSIPVNSA